MRKLLAVFFLAGLIWGSFIACGQEGSFKVIRSLPRYRESIARTPDCRMVELKELMPLLVYDLRYATRNNFVRRALYPRQTHTAFLRAPAARALQQVQQALSSEGLGLKIFDAYRPYAVTRKFWTLVQDERYVANPAKGSNHNRGTAIDLTLIDLETGKELDMGTGFDNFTDTAHHSFSALPENVLANRKLLKSMMEKFNFAPLTTEWWHYTYKSTVTFDVMDLPFKQLRRR